MYIMTSAKAHVSYPFIAVLSGHLYLAILEYSEKRKFLKVNNTFLFGMFHER